MTALPRAGASLAVALALLLPAACGAPRARAPQGQRVDLPKAFAEAFRADAIGDPAEAVRDYEAVISAAARAGDDPWQVAALESSADALATRRMPSLGQASHYASLARRTGAAVEAGIQVSGAEARGPFARSVLARALTALAEARGDAAAAEAARVRTGCVREAVVVGPLAWTPVTGVEAEGPLDRPGARLEAAYSTDGPFGALAHPTLVARRGCALALAAESARVGVREVVVDVDVPRAQTVGLVLRAHGAAVLRAGGTVVLRRPFELGEGEAARFARVSATAGTLRLAARVGVATEDDVLEIDVTGEDGAPLRAHAPGPGSSAAARVTHAESVSPPPPTREDEALLAAASAIASGSPHEAESLLWGAASRPDLRPDLALVYGRAVEVAHDLSVATRAERARSAYERTLAVWPESWEATVAHAVLAGVRRGRDEAGIEALRDLDAQRAADRRAGAPWHDAWIGAYEALTSARAQLFDRARSTLGAAARVPSALSAAAVDAATPSVGKELAARECDPARLADHDTLACFDALRATGDRAAAGRELDRLRTLLGAPDRYLPLELREVVAAGEVGRARGVYDRMLPAERSLSGMALAGAASPSMREALLAAAATARDAPGAVAPLLRAAGDDPMAAFEGRAEALAAQDRAHPILASAATAVLSHDETYDLSSSGLLHWVLFDLRRVSGTTDVEQNAQAPEPQIAGRSAARALRRRILKKDGRVLEPDQAPRASQAHADLSQLEQGDLVEALYEGWAVPGDSAQLGVDTPDLLPERVAVHEATVEVHLPAGLGVSIWSHPLLGKPVEKDESGRRTLSWHVGDIPGRRVEDGIPHMDRSANVTFTTARWSDVARALRETTAALDDHDPEIAAWARGALENAQGEASPRAVADAIVRAAGKALREADPGALSDYASQVTPVATETARTALSSHFGSRSWLVLRGLRELGIGAEIVVAENEPFSADAAFPPHFGRFVHPLVVARVASGTGPGASTEDVWIDADVAGPPLPAGHISPELRGRMALHADGTIAPLTASGSADGERDEIDIRLGLDEAGDAHGSFAVVLRGRAAQGLAESLVRSVGAERQRALREVVLGWLPWANVDDVQLSSSEGSWQVSLRAQVSVGGYAQPQGPSTWRLPGLEAMHVAWPNARATSLAATFAARAGRESALAVNAAVQYHVHRRVELPAGAAVARLPGPLDVKGALIEASRRIAVSGGGAAPQAVEDDFVLGVSTGTVSPDAYETFAHVAHAVDDGFLASVALELKPPGAPAAGRK